MSWFLSQEAFVAFLALLLFLLVLRLCHLMMILAKPQEGRPKKHQHRDNRRDDRAFVFLETSRPSRTHCRVYPDMAPINEIADQFNREIKNLRRYLDRLNWETAEGIENSSNSIKASEAGSPSSVSLSSSREVSHSSIMANETSSPTELCLSLCSDNSRTSLMESKLGSSSQESLPTLVGEADLAHASSVQPAPEHPRTNLEEQPGPQTFPLCEEDLASCLEASGVQQEQQNPEIQLSTPSPPPKVLILQSGETETLSKHHNDQDPLEDLITATELEWELGLPADVDETLQDTPVLAVPSPQQPEEHDVMVDIGVQHLPFLDETVKRELENDITNMQVQPLCGLPAKVLENEKTPEDIDLQQKAAQPPILCRCTVLPYRSPLQQQGMDRLSCETPDGSESSWTSITDSEAESSSRDSLTPSREDAHSSIMTSTDNSSADTSLSLSGEDTHNSIMISEASDDSWTSSTLSDAGCSSQAPVSTLVDEADMAHASRAQPDLGHPTTNLEEQPGPETFPTWEEELAIRLEAVTVQQQQQDREILRGAPTLTPEVPEVHSRETEMPITPHKDLDTLESLIPESKHEQKLGLPANVDETVPASARPKLKRPRKEDVIVVPIVQDLFFLTENMKNRLEYNIYKMNIQRRYGLHRRILECEESFEKLILR